MTTALLSIAILAATPRPPLDAAALRALPHVRRVEVVPVEEPRSRIVHVLNWHYVPREAFAADLRDQADEPLSDREIVRRYEEFLRDVDAVQDQQAALLRRLVRDFQLKTVYLEGLTPKNAAAYARLAKALWEFERNKPKGDTPIERLLLEQYRIDRLELGAAARLLAAGELDAVLPAEDAARLDAANPVDADGAVRFDVEANERRENAIVRAMLRGGKVAVIILGGGHDLSDNVPDGCEYVRVELEKYREAAGRR